MFRILSNSSSLGGLKKGEKMNLRRTMLNLIKRTAAHRSEIIPCEGDLLTERDYWTERLVIALECDNANSLVGRVLDMSLPSLGDISVIQTESKANPFLFQASGARSAVILVEELKEFGFNPRKMNSILEFGVGYARILRWFSLLPVRLSGCDATAAVIDWCNLYVPQIATFTCTRFQPPLPYGDRQFDFVYANSVFTHIQHKDTRLWIAELQRVVKPGGFVITTHYDLNEHLRYFKPSLLDIAFQRDGYIEWGTKSVRQNNIAFTFPALQELWGAKFKVLGFRQHLSEQSHLICQAE